MSDVIDRLARNRLTLPAAIVLVVVFGASKTVVSASFVQGRMR